LNGITGTYLLHQDQDIRASMHQRRPGAVDGPMRYALPVTYEEHSPRTASTTKLDGHLKPVFVGPCHKAAPLVSPEVHMVGRAGAVRGKGHREQPFGLLKKTTTAPPDFVTMC